MAEDRYVKKAREMIEVLRAGANVVMVNSIGSDDARRLEEALQREGAGIDLPPASYTPGNRSLSIRGGKI